MCVCAWYARRIHPIAFYQEPILSRKIFDATFHMHGVLAPRLFDAFDCQERSGTLDFSTFLCGLQLCCTGKEMELFFHLLDRDGDNYVTPDDVETWLRALVAAIQSDAAAQPAVSVDNDTLIGVDYEAFMGAGLILHTPTPPPHTPLVVILSWVS